MLWLVPFYEAVGLPKFDGMPIDNTLCEPTRLLLIGAANINPTGDMSVRPNDVGSVLFHRLPPSKPPS
jgi:hypothetical protein